MTNHSQSPLSLSNLCVLPLLPLPYLLSWLFNHQASLWSNRPSLFFPPETAIALQKLRSWPRSRTRTLSSHPSRTTTERSSARPRISRPAVSVACFITSDHHKATSIHISDRNSISHTAACTAASAPHPVVRDIIRKIPSVVTDKFYGCGNPIPLGIAGKRVLDLGSGSGRDCYVAAVLVGPSGSVTGIDMTDEQLQTARDNIQPYSDVLGYTPNIKFLTGHIEFLRGKL